MSQLSKMWQSLSLSNQVMDLWRILLMKRCKKKGWLHTKQLPASTTIPLLCQSAYLYEKGKDGLVEKKRNEMKERDIEADSLLWVCVYI